ncbi:MAG: DUF1987 domain-containing protein [Oscillospiraceae bacterium]|jgi:hypothetical protein|nr:DUF1987 domain-containing protein [Oscillospiraceae bacterium]
MAFFVERERTSSTPYTLVDESKGYMRLEGKCFHERVAFLFRDVNEFLAEYLAGDFGLFVFDCAIDYFNSSTTKLLHNMLMQMDKYSVGGNKVVINWLTTHDNDIMIECGEDFKEDIHNLEFNLVIK